MTDQTFAQRAKNYLSQNQKTDQLIQRLTETAGTLRSRLTSPRSAGRSDGGRASGPKDSLGEAAARVMDLEGEIDRRINTLVAQKSDALSRIWKIPDQDQKNILIARYVNGVKWEKIALELNFSIRQVHRIHGAALVDIAEREAINRYTTAQVKVEQQNTNYISQGTDLDGIMNAWSNDFAAKLDISGEGVHE